MHYKAQSPTQKYCDNSQPIPCLLINVQYLLLSAQSPNTGKKIANAYDYQDPCVIAEVEFEYASQRIPCYEKEQNIVCTNGDKAISIMRDIALEQNYLAEIRTELTPISEANFYIANNNLKLFNAFYIGVIEDIDAIGKFISQVEPRLIQQGWIVEYDDSFNQDMADFY